MGPVIHAGAQPVVGFWGVESVTVGERIVTPVAKWFVFEADHTYRSGNGWTQNDVGTWTYDKESNHLKPITKLGDADEYGAFRVRVSGANMIWEREEDGMPVVVTLSSIDEMPMSPGDKIQGNWDLVLATRGGVDVTKECDVECIHRIDVRRGKTYRFVSADSTESFGYWHMDAHAPEFHLIDFDRNVDFRVFTVSFENDRLEMRPKKGGDLILVYRRR